MTSIEFNGSNILGNYSNELVNLDLNNLSDHEEVRVEFDLYIIDSWDGNSLTNPNEGPDLFSVIINGAPAMLTTFTNAPSGSQSYPDEFMTDNPGLSGIAETGLEIHCYPGSFAPGFGSSRYEMSIDAVDTSSDLNIAFSVAGLSDICNESWGIDNVRVYVRASNTVWSTGETTASITVSPTETTTYSVEFTEGGVTCYDEAQIEVTTIDPGLPESITTCDEMVTLSAAEGYEYLWSTGETTSEITVNESGVYDVVVSEVGSGESAENIYSLEFEGCDWCDDYVTMGDVLDMQMNSFSYSVWFKPETLNAVWHQNIISKGLTGGGTPSQNGFKLDILPDSDQLRTVVGSNSNTNSVSSSPLNIGVWYHAFIVIDRENDLIKLYLNGQFESSLDISNVGTLNNNGHLHVGNQYWADTGQNAAVFDGAVDEFIFWDYALNESEIYSYYSCAPESDETGIIGYWDFDTVNGNIAVDQTGNNDGTIVSANYSEDTPETNCQQVCSATASVEVTIDICDCADPSAVNYNPEATSDDGSCIYCQMISLQA